MQPLSAGRNPPWTPGDTTEVDGETRESERGEQEKRMYAATTRERTADRGKTKQGNGRGKIT